MLCKLSIIEKKKYVSYAKKGVSTKFTRNWFLNLPSSPSCFCTTDAEINRWGEEKPPFLIYCLECKN